MLLLIGIITNKSRCRWQASALQSVYSRHELTGRESENVGRSSGSFHRATNGRATLLAWPSVKYRIGIGLVLSELLADRNRRGSYAESVPISHLYSQPWNLSSHSMGRLGEWFDFREWKMIRPFRFHLVDTSLLHPAAR